MTKEQIQKEIEGMDTYLPVSEIEKRLNMPPTTLQKVLSGKRELPKKWVKVLDTYFIRKEDKVVVKDLNTVSEEVRQESNPDTNYSVDTVSEDVDMMSMMQKMLEEGRKKYSQPKK